MVPVPKAHVGLTTEAVGADGIGLMVTNALPVKSDEIEAQLASVKVATVYVVVVVGATDTVIGLVDPLND